MQATQAEPQAKAATRSPRLTPRMLGLSLFAALGVLTLAVSALPVQRASSGSNPGRGLAPHAPLALNPKPLANLPAPPPAALARLDGSKVGFAATLDRTAVAKHGDGLVRLELVMKADEVAEAARAATDFVVVLDRSGSMSGDRISKARSAVLGLIDQLSPQDRLGLVIFDNQAERLIQLEAADAANKERWRAQVDDIGPGGGTNLSEGLDEALSLLERGRRSGRVGRLLLLSDGEANAGDITTEGLRARGQRAARGELVLSTIGVGEGFNESLMAQVADAGTGNFHYLADNAKLGSILERELSSTRATVASALRVQMALGKGVELVDAAGYPLERGAESVSFQPGALFSGQERRVWLTLRVPADQEQNVALGQLTLNYVEGGQARAVAPSQALAVNCVKDEAVAVAAIDKTTWERGVMQEEWGRVQQDVARAVREGKREEAHGYLSQYQAKQAPLSAKLGSSNVDGTLVESRALWQQVDDAFQGEDQSSKQNLLSKDNLSKGRGSRRWGSY